MILWWIGNVVLFIVILPVVVALINRVLGAIERIRGATDAILAAGVSLTGRLDDLPEQLATTGSTVNDVAVGATRYAGSVARLLS